MFSLAKRAGAAIVSTPAVWSGEHLSREAVHNSQAPCRVLARAEGVPPGSQAFSGGR